MESRVVGSDYQAMRTRATQILSLAQLTKSGQEVQKVPQTQDEYLTMELTLYQKYLLPKEVSGLLKKMSSSEGYIEDPIPATWLLHGSESMRPGLVARTLAAVLGAEYCEVIHWRAKDKLAIVKGLAVTGEEERDKVIYLHDVALVGRKDDGSKEPVYEHVIKQLVESMQQIAKRKEQPGKHVYVIGATSYYEQLPKEISQLFAKHVALELPSESTRRALLEELAVCHSSRRGSIIFADLAVKTEGFGFNDLKKLVSHAQQNAGSETLEYTHLQDTLEREQEFIAKKKDQDKQVVSLLERDETDQKTSVPHETFKTIALGCVPEPLLSCAELFCKRMQAQSSSESAYKARQPAVLLYGPHGCGKKFSTRAFAGEIGADLVEISCMQLLEPTAQKTQESIQQRFQELVKKQALAKGKRKIVLLKEIELLAPCVLMSEKDAADYRTIIAELLKNIAIMNQQAIVVAVTDKEPRYIDQEFLRYFSYRAEQKEPTVLARESLLRNRWEQALGPKEPQPDFATLADQTKGFTCAALEMLVQNAATIACVQGSEHVTAEHLSQALQDMKKVDDLTLPEAVRAIYS
jgi:SpoVK/Ycf46/Vps4 family AAA+-type ATPase